MDKARQEKIQELLNHRIFQIKKVSKQGLELYDQALTHSSFAGETLERDEEYINNERLEFLGNFVLGLVVSEYLYSEFNYSEGAMTTRMEVVSDAKLADVIKKKKLKLDKGYLRLGKRRTSTKSGLEDSIIAGWLEAFIGAIYIDKGLDKAREVVLRLLADEIRRFDPRRNYIGRLQELVQQNKMGNLKYFEKKVTGPDHKPTFKAQVKISNKKYGEGTGNSKKAARMKAAQAALKKLTT